MKNTIIIKSGNGAPKQNDLLEGELGFDFANKVLYIGAEKGKNIRLNGIKDIDEDNISFNTNSIVGDNTGSAVIGSAIIGAMVIGAS